MAKKVKEKWNWKKEIGLAPAYASLILWSLITIILIGWVFAASLSTPLEIFGGTLFDFETGFHFENYVNAWNSGNVSVYFMNSLIYASTSCVLIILIAAPAAYVLSRFKFAGNKIFQSGLVSAMGVPVVMVILPLFAVIAGLNLLDNQNSIRFVMIYLYVGINIPYTIIFLMTFFANISKSFEEAAAIDGCTPMKTFWKVMLPMAQPGIITVTIFNFIAIWNEYFLSLIFANSNDTRSVAVGLFSMIDAMKFTGDWGGLFAAVIIVFLPTFVIYIFLSEKIIAGVTGGGVKG